MNWTNLSEYIFSLSVNQPFFTSVACYTFQRVCAQKHTALEVSPLWCHWGHWYLTNPLDWFRIVFCLPPPSYVWKVWQSLSFSRKLKPSRILRGGFASLDHSWYPFTGGTASWCSCRWWARCTVCLRVGWGLCFCHLTFSQLVEGADQLQDVWVVKTTWDGTNTWSRWRWLKTSSCDLEGDLSAP